MSGSLRSNRGFTQMEPLINVAQLKERYLFGVEIVDNDGNSLPDKAIQSYINTAVSMLEHYLDLAIMPRSLGPDTAEEKDYYMNDYFEWGYLQLNNFPVISIEDITISYLKDNNLNDIAVLDIPPAWIRLQKETGIVRLVPNNKFPSRLQVGSDATFFPELFRRQGFVPDLWKVQYTYGFKEGKVPVMMNEVIARIASLQALSIAGNLVLGAGIAGSSISLDGLSQSIQTTQSAENSAYSATRKEYYEQLFGKTKNDPFSMLKILRNYYKGQNINII